MIGGGITGAGIALDAASRGLRTVLVERHDLAHGTSRWSSKLVHGGLRYLASGQFGIAHESAAERHLLMTRIAPHLTRPLAQVMPLYAPGHMTRGAYVGVGYGLGDGLRRLVGTPDAVLQRARADRARRDSAPRARRARRRTPRRACAAGTGSSSTTRGSSSPSRARRPATERRVLTRVEAVRVRGRRRGAARRADRRGAARPRAGGAQRDRRVGGGARPRRAAAPEPRHAPRGRDRADGRLGCLAHRPGAGIEQPVRLHGARAARAHLHRDHGRARRRAAARCARTRPTPRSTCSSTP